MEAFTIVDLSLLGAFLIFLGIFLYVKRQNIKKEGWLLLYKTKWGTRLIENTAKKHPKTLKVLGYVALVVGYILMALMIYLFIKIILVYTMNTDAVKAVKIPPIAPLIPYLPQIFKLSFLPNFYFIYWIIIIAVIAIPHEFFHGIFMRLYGIKIKSTGFGFFPFFLPVFLAAFVEQDEKSMVKAKNRDQRVVLAAGTFANILTALIGLLVIFAFFSFSYAPSGVVFDDYAYNIVDVSNINYVNGHNFTNPTYDEILPFLNDSQKNIIKTPEGIYVGVKGTTSDKKRIALYYDAPAINANLYGPIKQIDGNKVKSFDSFRDELSKYSVGDNVTFTTRVDGNDVNYSIVLIQNPEDNQKAWMGVVFQSQNKGVMASFVGFFSSYKKPHLYYEPLYPAAPFIYDLLWWLIIISFSVALINMLPMGIFDGGRFFYLTILKLTKSEKIAKNSFKWITYLLLALVLLIMIYWAKAFF